MIKRLTSTLMSMVSLKKKILPLIKLMMNLEKFLPFQQDGSLLVLYLEC
jgi:hypothetical protein